MTIVYALIAAGLIVWLQYFYYRWLLRRIDAACAPIAGRLTPDDVWGRAPEVFRSFPIQLAYLSLPLVGPLMVETYWNQWRHELEAWIDQVGPSF